MKYPVGKIPIMVIEIAAFPVETDVESSFQVAPVIKAEHIFYPFLRLAFWAALISHCQ